MRRRLFVGTADSDAGWVAGAKSRATRPGASTPRRGLAGAGELPTFAMGDTAGALGERFQCNHGSGHGWPSDHLDLFWIADQFPLSRASEGGQRRADHALHTGGIRSEEHTSELQSPCNLV